ncbi:hypothetical protein [Funiculus sociatus]|uniref:hypothetical protein n=1 Tax=Funiculus sociatus TaxID=450527 RepID=UPI00329A14E6
MYWSDRFLRAIESAIATCVRGSALTDILGEFENAIATSPFSEEGSQFVQENAVQYSPLSVHGEGLGVRFLFHAHPSLLLLYIKSRGSVTYPVTAEAAAV